MALLKLSSDGTTLAAPCCHPAVSILLYAPLMRRAERLFQIIQILRRSKGPVTAAALGAELETSKRSVYCDNRPSETSSRGGDPVDSGLGSIVDQNADCLCRPV